jgi:hypothetical protein
MKSYILIAALTAMLIPTTLFAEEHEHNGEHQAMERQIHLRRAQMELEQHESELDFEREMREMELRERHIELDRQTKPLSGKPYQKHHGKCPAAPILLLLCLAINILLTVWVYQDIKKRNTGSGIWIVVTLLAGLFGALVYALTRIGDNKQPQ